MTVRPFELSAEETRMLIEALEFVSIETGTEAGRKELIVKVHLLSNLRAHLKLLSEQ